MSVSRRELLAAALAAGLVPPAFASSGVPHLRGGQILPDPDFTQLRAVDPYVVGVRPHRRGGVRLELEAAPLQGAGGPKALVHDYGHGGAGITLAFGCAVAVAGFVAEAAARHGFGEAPTIAVIGTGVAGLTAASEVRRRFPSSPVTVYAKDLDLRKTTSWLAAGQFEPSGIWREYQDRSEVLAGLLRGSRDRILALREAGHGDAHGIAERDNYTLDHELPAFDRYTPSDVVKPYEAGLLPFARLSAPGRVYRTWLLNPTRLLPRLAEDLAASGVRFEQRTFRTRDDLAALPEQVIVNCTGYGAKDLVADANVVPQRGHLVMLRKTDARQDWFFGGGCGNDVISYVFCRQDDIVVGGTVLSGQDATAIGPDDDAVFRRLLANGGELFSGRVDACQAG